jgi:DNA-binding beta-propeller fold protein YncE
VRRALPVILALLLVLALAATAQAARTLYVVGVFGKGISSLAIGAGGGLTATLGSPSGTAGPNGVALTPDGAHFFATDAGKGEIYTYDVNPDGSLKSTGGIVVEGSADPDAIAISPDGTRAYVTDGEPEAIRIYVIEPNGSLAPVETKLLPGSDNVNGIAITPDGTQLFASSSNPPARIYGFDVAPSGSLSPQTPAFVSALAGVEALTIRPNGNTLYASSSGTGGIQAFALEEGTLLELKGSPYASGVEHHGIVVSPDGKYVYATREGAPKGSLESFAIGELGNLVSIGGPVAAAGETTGIAVTPDGRYVYSAGDITDGGISSFAANAGLLALASPTPLPSEGKLSFFDSLATSPNQPPRAEFSAQQEGRSDLVRFDAGAAKDPDGTIARYDWDFGDGTTLPDGGPTPAHTYLRPGTFSATLTLTDAEGCSTAFVFTGQTAACNGSGVARATRTVLVTDPPPRLRLFGPKRQKLRRTVTLRASCDEPCRVTARATLLLQVPGAKASALRKLKVRPATKRLVPGKRTTLKLTLPNRTLAAARASLSTPGAIARLRITATATDSRAQRSKAPRTIRLLP